MDVSYFLNNAYGDNKVECLQYLATQSFHQVLYLAELVHQQARYYPFVDFNTKQHGVIGPGFNQNEK